MPHCNTVSQHAHKLIVAIAKEDIVCACAWGRDFGLDGDVSISHISQNCSIFHMTNMGNMPLLFLILLTYENNHEIKIALTYLQ